MYVYNSKMYCQVRMLTCNIVIKYKKNIIFCVHTVILHQYKQQTHIVLDISFSSSTCTCIIN